MFIFLPVARHTATKTKWSSLTWEILVAIISFSDESNADEPNASDYKRAEIQNNREKITFLQRVMRGRLVRLYFSYK